jgi:hypothetical protein
MSAHTIGTFYEQRTANFEGQKLVSGQFTGSASYDLGGSTLDLSTAFADECRGAWICDTAGEWVGLYVPTASTNAAATGKVMVKGISWDDVVLAHDATCFDAAATTDAADVWAQPANSELLGCRVTLDTPFVATSMTALTIEIGDTGAADANAFYAGSADLVADAAASVTVGPGAEIGSDEGTVPSYVWGATNRKLTATSTGANLSTTTAGQITVRFYFSPVTAQGYAPRGMGEVHSGQVLSGSTFNFIAWGTDA